MTTRRITLAVLSLLMSATALLPASPASAAQDTRIRMYKVTAEGWGTYQYDLSLGLGDGLGTTWRRNVSFAWKAELPTVAFFSNGEGITLTGQSAGQGSLTGSATEEATVVGDDGHGGRVTTHGYCEAKDQSQPLGATTVKPDPRTGDSNAGGANITVSVFGAVEFPANCTAAIYGGHSRLAVDAQPSQFEQRFFLPAEATRQGKIIQLVEASPQQKDRCASELDLGTCKLDWHGTLTFEFAGYLGGDGELTPEDLPDLPAGGGNGGDNSGEQPPPPPPPVDDEDLIVPLPSGGSLSRSGDRASVKVTCGAACSGVVNAFPAAAGAHHAAAKPLAKARFKAPAGRAVKVTLRFRGAALRKVRRARAVRLVVATAAAKKTVVVRAR